MLLRSAPTVVAPLILTIMLFVPASASADLRIHAEGAGAAPLDRVLRATGPGFSVGGAIDYEVVDLLAVGIYYSFNDFIRRGEVLDVYDHAVGARLDLRFVRHSAAGWFGSTSGNAYGEAFLELDLAYHNIGQEHRIGWGFGLGYRVIIAGPFGLGPFFRFSHIVSDLTATSLRECERSDDDDDSTIHQLYVTFGLTFFFSFDLTGESADEQTDDQDEDQGSDEWSGFEPASDDED